MNNCLECKKLTGGFCEKCLKEQDSNFMNQTTNRIREEWTDKFDEYYPELLTEAGEVRENVKDFIDELLKSQRDSLVEKIEKHQNFITMLDYDVGYNDCKENIINLIKE